MLDPESLIRELIHRTCIGAVAQPETGGDLLLHFGDWQPYETPPNPALLATERGKWSLMLSSAWRFDGPSGVICDWRSVSDPEKESQESHMAFEGLRVEAIKLVKPGNDLELIFSHGHTLRSLCDSFGTGDDCWYILRPDASSVAATHDYRLIYEPPAS
jgi:hypothetical protein